jgi:asparagine synthase (glutamine-hydrolysing)
VAGALGTDHAELRLTQGEFADRLPQALDALDQPTFDAVNTWFVSHAAREAGMTVALAGTGGDELFGGYASFTDLPRAVRVGRVTGFLPDALSRRAAGVVARARTGPFGEVPPQTRWGKLGDALAARGDLVRAYQVAYGLFSTDFQRTLIDDDRIPPIQLGLTRERADELARLVEGAPRLAAISLLELATFVGERLLRDTDVAGMSASLEVRVPLLDHRVVESVLGLAEERRFLPLGRKQALRDAALDRLDPALFERPKSGFVLPIERWCRDGLRDEVGEVLNDRDACDAVGLRREPVAALWRAFQAGAPGIYWSRVWSLYVLMRWARAHRLRV